MSTRRSEVQRRILQATRELLERDGAAAVRLADVGAAAGVSRQAVYLNFGSRVGLLVALVEYLDEQGRILEQAKRWNAEGLTADERLDEFLSFWNAYVPRIRQVAVALLAEQAWDEAAAAAWKSRMALLHRAASYLVDQLAKEGRLAPDWKPGEAADWLWGLVSVELRVAMNARGWSRRRYAERLRRVVRGALLAGDPE